MARDRTLGPTRLVRADSSFRLPLRPGMTWFSLLAPRSNDIVRFFNSSWSFNRILPKAGGGRRRGVARTVRLRLERLEDRMAPAVDLTTVNDNWFFIADNDNSGSLTVG